MAGKVGKPLKWPDPQEFASQIGGYFLQCTKDKKRPSKAGLIVWLDTSRESLREYGERPEYVDAIKRAYSQIEAAWVDRLDDQAATGAIFYLKNAFSKEYRDKVETDVTTGGDKINSTADILALATQAAKLLKEKKT